MLEGNLLYNFACRLLAPLHQLTKLVGERLRLRNTRGEDPLFAEGENHVKGDGQWP